MRAPATIPRALACLALAGAACSRATALVATPEWHVAVDATLSRKPQPGMDSPVPTELRLYQLRTLGAFEATSYEQLQDDDRAALGETLLERHADRVFLYPDRPWRGELTIAPGARYVVLVAFLHRPVGRSWSYVAALPPSPPPGAPATPQQIAARPTGFAVVVGPDRVAGRPLYSPAPPPEPRRRLKHPPPPAAPSAPSAPSLAPPSAPAAPTAPTPAAPALPSPTTPALPLPPRP
jgi:type VI secretion system VasD/TssJ family lipoprotein